MLEIQYAKVLPVTSLNKGTKGSAGYDLYVPDNYEPFILKAGESTTIRSGLYFLIPEDHCLLAVNKGGKGSQGLDLGACLIDLDYRGEVFINIFNRGKEDIPINPGNKIIQVLLLPVPPSEVKETTLENILSQTTERGDGCLGSTGQ